MRDAADVRGFYAALGIELPGWAGANANVRCFADPDAHAHEDRRPSCSVSTEHGAWLCWSCGARGGAYDAALAVGHTPASAIQLMIRFGLAEPRSDHEPTARRSGVRVKSIAARRPLAGLPSLIVSEHEVDCWREALFCDRGREVRRALAAGRLWSEVVMRELELGFDGARITIPIRNGAGGLRGLLRYRPGAEPKMLAARGTRLGLIPHPVREPGGPLTLVEGPADMLALRSHGCPAIAVPGDHAWRREWARLLEGREITIVMDCDLAGRTAAQRIAHDLGQSAAVRILDLAPQRSDGFDVTDWLRQRHQPRRTTCIPSWSSTPTTTR